MQKPPSEAPPGGRRARTKENNRAAILDAGRRVFSTLGYDAATIRDVVRESGLSPGTFYNYFPDKQAVFAVLVDDVLQRLRPRLAAARADATSADAFLFDAFRAAVQTLVEEPEMLEVVGRSATAFRAHLHGGSSELGGLYEELVVDLRAALARGLLPPVPVELVASAMLGATVEICVSLARTPGAADVDRTARFLADLFAGGIAKMAGSVPSTTKRA